MQCRTLLLTPSRQTKLSRLINPSLYLQCRPKTTASADTITNSQTTSTSKPKSSTKADTTRKPRSQASIPSPRTLSKHDSLPTFLKHAQQTSLCEKSSVYIGTHYEYLALSQLTPYGFELQRVGGAGDKGIDLLGKWQPPCLAPSRQKIENEKTKEDEKMEISVVVQCKAEKNVRPAQVRELEGVVSSRNAARTDRDNELDGDGVGMMGWLVSQGEITAGVRDAVRCASVPLGFICLKENGTVRQMLWNARATQMGLEGLGVGVKYGGDGSSKTAEQVVLTWKGKPWMMK